MTLLSGLLLIGLTVVSCITYLTLEQWHQAEMTAQRELVRLYREAVQQEHRIHIHLDQTVPSGFFKVGADMPEILDESCQRQVA